MMKNSHLSKHHSSVLSSLPIKTLWALWYIMVVAITPFTITAIIYEHYVLLSSFVLFIGSASFYLYHLIQRNTPPISIYIPLFFMCLIQSLGVYYTGVQGVFWAYPIIIVCYFIVSINSAQFFATLLTIQSGVFLYLKTDLSMTLRFVFSIVIVCILVRIMIDFVLSLKDDLVNLSHTDHLTGAYNRRYMDEKLRNNIHERSVSTLLMIDIDHFKQVNDIYGHSAGDAVLKKLVTCLKENSRSDDFIFRIGGEEFVMLLSNTNKEQAVAYVAILLEKLSKITIDGTDKNITVSVGGSELTEELTIQDWLKEADTCLYKAKLQGRDQVVFSS